MRACIPAANVFYSTRKKQYLNLRIPCLREYFYAGKSQNNSSASIIPQDLGITNCGVLQGANLEYLALLILNAKSSRYPTSLPFIYPLYPYYNIKNHPIFAHVPIPHLYSQARNISRCTRGFTADDHVLYSILINYWHKSFP